MNQYRKNTLITAVQINLDTGGLEYSKWGGPQLAKAGDWLVDNGGECYTVDADSFANTYEEVSPGRYIKTAVINATVATEPGFVKTKEGRSHYFSGDYLVSNNEDGTDNYVVSKDKFEKMYELVGAAQ